MRQNFNLTKKNAVKHILITAKKNYPGYVQLYREIVSTFILKYESE